MSIWLGARGHYMRKILRLARGNTYGILILGLHHENNATPVPPREVHRWVSA